MRYSLILNIALCISAFQTIAQGTTNFEIWGWDGEKQQFVDVYSDSIGTDLNYGYTCTADLKKMGYEYSRSIIYLDDPQQLASGTLNWDSTERLAIIRQIPLKKYAKISKKGNEKIQKASEGLLEKASTYLIERLTADPKLRKLILLGTLSDNRDIRLNCLNIFSKCQTQPIPLSKNDTNILAEMLSFPDPATTYLAMNLITNVGLPESMNPTLFSQNAVTISDFLNSELRSFRPDAMAFLKHRFPHEKANSSQEWQDVIRSVN